MFPINYLTNIQFGYDAIKGLEAALSGLDVKRPLLVSDAGIQAAGILEIVQSQLSVTDSRAVFLETPTNPTEAAALAALSVYKTNNCDGVIGLGGGSAIDLAKVVALLATHMGPLSQYAAIEGGISRITPVVVPVIAVPTTAGTGAEVGRAALITLADGRKVGVISPYLIPKIAVCDPELTLGLPAGLTAATGMDAIIHCIETFLSPRYNPPAEAIALDGLARGMANLLVAVTNGRDRLARSEMMMAAVEGGLTFQKGLGAVHGLSHALGSLKQPSMHHGTLNSILLPFVLDFNEPEVPAEKWSRLLDACSCPQGMSLSEHFREFTKRLGLPQTLEELGYAGEEEETVLGRAVADHSTATNPRAIAYQDYKSILKQAMGASAS